MSEYWAHQFTKVGNPTQIGEEPLYNDESSKTMRKIYAQPMRCVHCGKEFLQGKESRPGESCPARNDKRELKRIHK